MYSLRKGEILFLDVDEGVPMLIFVRCDCHTILGDQPVVIITIIRNVKSEILEDRYAADVCNPVLI